MKLLVAYDGSQHSQSAVTDLQLAGLPADTEAVVLSVLDDRSSDVDAAIGETELREVSSAIAGEEYERQLAIAQQGADLVCRLFPSWTVTAESRVGSPAWEIIKRAEGDAGQAETGPFGLVVLGSRGLGAFKRLLLGSVTHRVVTTLRGSVRVSRGRLDRVHPQSEAGVPTPPRLLLGVDGSPDAQAAIEAVASRSWPFGTRIVVATFVAGSRAMVLLSEPDTVWGDTPLLPDSPAAEARPSLRVVSEAAEFLRRRHPELCVTTLVRPADPKYGLLGAAESAGKDGADCIFVGATGIRGIERFLVGSVSTTVAMNATCSVEIVRRRA